MTDILQRLRGPSPSIMAMRDGADEIEYLRRVHDDHKRLVRELDVALNGADGAATQASLCDIVAQIKDGRWKLVRDDTRADAIDFPNVEVE